MTAPKPAPPPRSSPLRLAVLAGRTMPHPAPSSPEEAHTDPQLSLGYWMHPCPQCTTWVPNHRRACARHEQGEQA